MSTEVEGKENLPYLTAENITLLLGVTESWHRSSTRPASISKSTSIFVGRRVNCLPSWVRRTWSRTCWREVFQPRRMTIYNTWEFFTTPGERVVVDGLSWHSKRVTIMTQMTRKILRKKYRHNRHLPSQMADLVHKFTRDARERESVVPECNEHRKCTATVYCTFAHFLRILADTIGA